ncbi:MAG: ferredoxin [Parvularcula sp.]|jgi:ferredoxin|nr:ferredoxin [Parvularcula sp.]
MKVRIDPEVCAGFRVCIGVCPEMFAINDEGYAEVALTDVPPEHQALVRTAADQCPSDAISISEGSE